MGQPLGIREGLCFANSIIEGTVHEEAMVSLKTRLNIRGSDESTLGSKYWRNFRRRHEDIIESSSDTSQTRRSSDLCGRLIILKKRDREHEALEHGEPPATGGGATREHS